MEGRMTDIYHSMTNRAPGKRQIKWQEHNVLSLIQEEGYDEENDEDFLAADNANSSSGSDDDTDDEQYVDDKSSESNGDDDDEKEKSSPDVPSTSKASCSTSSNKPSTSNATTTGKRKRITSTKVKKRRRNENTKEAKEEGEAVNVVRKITSRMEKGGNALASKLRKIQSQVEKTKNKILKTFVDNGAEICQVCLRGGGSGREREILVCCNCGTSIHPECYSGNRDKKCISKSRKMWFCERCLSKSHPNCELCPMTEGYMKETSNNQWIHIVCARYLFRGKLTYTGENDNIIDVSNLNYKLYGAKECILCEDTLVAKTGICISCDAGMCKTYFHVTCAQRYGLLAQQDSDFYSEANDVYCPLHSREEVYLPLQKKFFLSTALNNIRLSKFEKDRKDTRDRRERSLHEQHELFMKKKANRPKTESVLDGPPPSRPLHSCAETLRNMNEKAKLHFGLNLLNPSVCLLTPHEIRKSRHVPPSLSGQFTQHFIDRYLRIQEAHERVIMDNEIHEKLSNSERSFIGDRGGVHNELKSVESELKSLHQTTAEFVALDEAVKKWVQTNSSSIVSLIQQQNLYAMTQKRTRAYTLKPLEVVEVETMKTEEKTSTIQQEIREEPGISSPSSSLLLSPGAMSTSSEVDGSKSSIVIHTCRKCELDNKQHLMTECGVCRSWFHLQCCDPPLSAMPRKHKFFVWQCAECDASEEENDTTILGASDETAAMDTSTDSTSIRGRLQKKRLRTESRKYSPESYQRPRKSKSRTSRDKITPEDTTSLQESLKSISPKIVLPQCSIPSGVAGPSDVAGSSDVTGLSVVAGPSDAAGSSDVAGPSTTATSTGQADKTSPKAAESQPTTTAAPSPTPTTSASNNKTAKSGASIQSEKKKRKRKGPITTLTRRRRRRDYVNKKKQESSESHSSVVEVDPSIPETNEEKDAKLAQNDSVQDSAGGTETTAVAATTTTAEEDTGRMKTVTATPVGEAVVVSSITIKIKQKDEIKSPPPTANTSSTASATLGSNAVKLQQLSSPIKVAERDEAAASEKSTRLVTIFKKAPGSTKRGSGGRRVKKTRTVADSLARLNKKKAMAAASGKTGEAPGEGRETFKIVTPTRVEFLPGPFSSRRRCPPTVIAKAPAESSASNIPIILTSQAYQTAESASSIANAPVLTSPAQIAESLPSSIANAAVVIKSPAQTAESSASSIANAAVVTKSPAQTAESSASSIANAAVVIKSPAQTAESSASSIPNAAVVIKSPAQTAESSASSILNAAVVIKSPAQTAESLPSSIPNAAVVTKSPAQIAESAASSIPNAAVVTKSPAQTAESAASSISNAAVVIKSPAQTAESSASSIPNAAVVIKSPAQTAESSASSIANAAVVTKSPAQTAESSASSIANAAVVIKSPAQTAESSASSIPNAAVVIKSPAQIAESLPSSIPNAAVVITSPVQTAESSASSIPNAAVVTKSPAQTAESSPSSSNALTAVSSALQPSDGKITPSTAAAGDGREAPRRSPLVFALPMQQLPQIQHHRVPPRVVDDSALKQLADIASLDSIRMLGNAAEAAVATGNNPGIHSSRSSPAAAATTTTTAAAVVAPERIAHPSTLAARKKAMKRKTAEWKAAAASKKKKKQEREDSARDREENPEALPPDATKMRTLTIQELKYRGGDRTTTTTAAAATTAATSSSGSGTPAQTQDPTRTLDTTTPATAASSVQIVNLRKRAGEINPATSMTASQILRARQSSGKTPDPKQRSTFRLVQSLSETLADSKRQKLMVQQKNAGKAPPVIVSPPRRPAKLCIQTGASAAAAAAVLPNSPPPVQPALASKETTRIVVTANQSTYKRVVYTAQGQKKNESTAKHIPKEVIRLAKAVANSDQPHNGEVPTLLKSSLGLINLPTKPSPMMSTATINGGGGGGVQFTRTQSGLILLSPTPGTGGSPMMESVKAITVLENGASINNSPSVENKSFSEESLRRLKSPPPILAKPLTSRIVNPPMILSWPQQGSDSGKANVIKPLVISTNSAPVYTRSTIPCSAAFKQSNKLVACNKEAAADTPHSPTSSGSFAFTKEASPTPTDGSSSSPLLSPTLVQHRSSTPVPTAPSEQMRNIIRSPLDVALISNADTEPPHEVAAAAPPPAPPSVDEVALERPIVLQVERKVDPSLDASIIDLCDDDDDDDETAMTSPRHGSCEAPSSAPEATVTSPRHASCEAPSSSAPSQPPPEATVSSPGGNDAGKAFSLLSMLLEEQTVAPIEEAVETATCGECKKTDSVDNMQACSECAAIRHHQCWDPPVSGRNRRRNRRFFTWQCSGCALAKSRKEAEIQVESAEKDDDDGSGRTRKRSTRKRKLPDTLLQEMRMAQIMKTPKKAPNRGRQRRKSMSKTTAVSSAATEEQKPLRKRPPTPIPDLSQVLSTTDVTQDSADDDVIGTCGEEDVAALRDHDYLPTNGNI